MTDELINKVLQGQASSDDAAHVANWFNQPEGNMDLINRIDADLNQEWERKYASRSTWTLRYFVSRAAVVLLIMIGSLGVTYSIYHHYVPLPISDQVAYAARGERTQVVLQDGTRIYLNSGSQITFPSRFSLRERRIHLDGEAYFEVAKNAHRPFIVEMNDAEVTVLGTQFDAYAYEGEPVRVMLDEGSVRFSANGIEDVTLVPGEIVYYDAQLASARVERKALHTADAWRSHRINITNMPLAELIPMLERQYDVTFRVDNQRCYRHSYTFEMDDSKLSEVLNRMNYLSPLTFRYDQKNKQVIVR